ncbi:DUF4442 domain-containing protein [Pseudomonas citronellolis]|uniref:DUF4442 domain-containing protein n=1 Tax=Pseudomonas citronellolis TaxID=53408 RepID=UPI0023E3742D|nr:DUF4442 domain-containing protein [Pseudomonas citronellolis]MDF3936344.1 DUF4442 domain-containing protein [Pseudomonas citronellolis]
MPTRNRLALAASLIQRLPRRLHEPLLSRLFGSQVHFAGTARVRIHSMTTTEVRMSLANRRRVQNHIKGVHAAAMALLAESASGCVLGMNLPDDKLPLITCLKVDYLRRARGDLRATATLDAQQRQAILEQERGEIDVRVTVTDASGEQPIHCEMRWAWVSRRR